MYTPIPANTPAPTAPTSSMTSNTSSASNGNSATSSNTNTRSGVNGASGASSNERARSGSGISSFLNTFGIRQNNQAASAASTSTVPDQRLFGTTPSNSHMNVVMESANTAPPQQEPRLHHPIQMPPSAQFQVHRNYQLPISISLTAPMSADQHQPPLQMFGGSNAAGAQEPLNQRQSMNTTNTTTSTTIMTPAALTRNNTGFMASGAEGSTAVNNQEMYKNLRHLIYAANQPNGTEILHLDLPVTNAEDSNNTTNVDEATLKQRKDKHGLFSIRLTPFIDSSSSTSQGLFFEPIIRKAGPGSQLVIGRYTERVRDAISKIPEQYHPVVFKSKVVSRTHGCFKVDSQGNWYIKDVKSSSGTFLNHQRLSPASSLSKDTLLRDGDILQLGMDFRGGTEEIYRCVRMRVELNRSWKLKANSFNKEALQRLQNLQKLTTGVEEEDCSICLCKIKPCQAIFISPCAHSWHFRCVRRLVMLSYPQFVCPNCRSSCDLEASFESSDEEDESDIESEGDQLVDQLSVLMESPKDVDNHP
ncbi:dma2p [Saccharomyces arboricola H-6]|uniref:RING-type E3 ubiquitin transferase n=1 Tax=Saccharomyces arboricola (strain H-6 / AS 2.3317 / CBS 10644) TaxID=1160507 RepID=J8Q332_SACAR|nr:dma2p [Saccharomyces arboricola H-6]